MFPYRQSDEAVVFVHWKAGKDKIYTVPMSASVAVVTVPGLPPKMKLWHRVSRAQKNQILHCLCRQIREFSNLHFVRCITRATNSYRAKQRSAYWNRRASRRLVIKFSTFDIVHCDVGHIDERSYSGICLCCWLVATKENKYTFISKDWNELCFSVDSVKGGRLVCYALAFLMSVSADSNVFLCSLNRRMEKGLYPESQIPAYHFP